MIDVRAVLNNNEWPPYLEGEALRLARNSIWCECECDGFNEHEQACDNGDCEGVYRAKSW
jgi:hypothetical protein